MNFYWSLKFKNLEISASHHSYQFSLLQSLSRVWLLDTPWTAVHQVSLSFTISQSLLKLLSIEMVMPPNHPILCCPLLHFLSIFASIRVFSNQSAFCIRWPKYCSFSWDKYSEYSIFIPEYSGLISFRIDWLDLLAAQVTLKSLLQYFICQCFQPCQSHL